MHAASAEGAGPVAPSYLYFGCRNEAKDFYYRGFWESCQCAGVLADPGGLVTAFSRDQASKVYVSQRVRETSAQLWTALQQVRPLHRCAALCSCYPARNRELQDNLLPFLLSILRRLRWCCDESVVPNLQSVLTFKI